MSLSAFCFGIAALVLLAVGFHVIEPTKFDTWEVAAGFIALGLALGGVALPFVIGRKE